MSAGENMVCPGCGTFQVRADDCKKCGVIVAKVQKVQECAPAMNVEMESTATRSPGVSPALRYSAVALLLLGVVNYLFLPGEESETYSATTSTADNSLAGISGNQTRLDRIAVVSPAIANSIQGAFVASQLFSLRNMLNLYVLEKDEPPGNQEGLQALVDAGFLSQAEITDAWNNIIVYRLEWGEETVFGTEYTIYLHSKGPDGISGNSDDIAL